jgi:protein involved in polysaccharide export with SLBB domain
MTVLDAVNRAGGFTPEADFSRVLLTRRGTTYLVDVQAMYDYGADREESAARAWRHRQRYRTAATTRSSFLARSPSPVRW